MQNRRMSPWAIRRCSSSRQGVCGTPGGLAPRSSGGSPATARSKCRCACPPPSRSSRCARSWSAWPMSVTPRPRRIVAHPDEQLAEVLTPEQAPEGPRGVLQAFHDVLLVPDLPLLEPPRVIPQEVGLAPRVIGDDEALDQRPLDRQRHRVGPGGGSAALDSAIRPTSGMGAPRLIRRKTASSTGPPTLS